ncbi:MAG: hypothetical protein ACR2O5_08805 [Thiogranum sp.]
MNKKVNDVSRFADSNSASVVALLERFDLVLELAERGTAIRGSYWGDEEAGLVDNVLIARPDTPLHSILHEACHFICMDQSRRESLDTNAGGDYDEENAVCYLQILLADEIPGFGRDKMLRDMDTWGYTFRLGSALSWFQQDSEDTRQWLLAEGLISPSSKPVFRLRESGKD